MVQRQSGDVSVSAYCKGTGIHVKRVVVKEIVLITLFQDTHLVKEMQIRIQTFKLFAFRVIQAKGGGFLVGKGHP
jgi:hypothetical protein